MKKFNTGDYEDGGLVEEHSRILFHPTKVELHDQCFNFYETLIAFLLPRLKYMHKHNKAYSACFATPEEKESLDKLSVSIQSTPEIRAWEKEMTRRYKVNLGKVIKTFEVFLKRDDGPSKRQSVDDWARKQIELDNQMEEALKMLALIFPSLSL